MLDNNPDDYLMVRCPQTLSSQKQNSEIPFHGFSSYESRFNLCDIPTVNQPNKKLMVGGDRIVHLVDDIEVMAIV